MADIKNDQVVKPVDPGVRRVDPVPVPVGAVPFKPLDPVQEPSNVDAKKLEADKIEGQKGTTIVRDTHEVTEAALAVQPHVPTVNVKDGPAPGMQAGRMDNMPVVLNFETPRAPGEPPAKPEPQKVP